MAAYCDGRSQVEELDTFLLQHVMWQRIDNVPKIHDWLLNEVSAEFGNKQLASLLFSTFMRLPSALARPYTTDKLLVDVVDLKSTVVARYAASESAAATPWNAGRNLWLSEEESQAIGTAISGRIASSRSGLQKLMEWVPTMEALLRFSLEPDGQAFTPKMDLVQALLYSYYASLSGNERAKLSHEFTSTSRDVRLNRYP